MPSYLSYMRQMAVLDADDNEIESWITVRGNHIPIKKGQSKEDAVKSFIASKGGNAEKGSNKKSELSLIYHKDKGHVKEGRPPKDWSKVEGATTAPNGYSWYSNGKSMFGGERESYLYKDEKEDATPAQQHATTRNIMTLFSEHYEDLYDGKTKSNRELVKEFDDKMANDPEFKKQVQAFVRERGDVLSSDREVQAYMMAYNTVKSKLEPAMKKLEEYHKKDTEKESKKDVYAGTPFALSKLKNTGYGEALRHGKNNKKMSEAEAEEYRKGTEKQSEGAKEEPHYFHKWTIEAEKPHNLKTDDIKEKLNFYRFVRSNGRSDDNELLDKIHDLSDELERRKK